MLRRLNSGTENATRATDSERLPFDVWNIQALNAMENERTGYPTQKPIELYKRIIEASSNNGDLILDPFCGCGTTLMAAEGLKRQLDRDRLNLSRNRSSKTPDREDFPTIAE